MKIAKQNNFLFQRNITAILAFILAVSIFNACSNSGNRQKTQMNIDSTDPQQALLYIVNGEKVSTDSVRNIISRVKPKYIKRVKVISGKRAVYAFGQRAKNGVIKMKIPNEEKAFHDLFPRHPASASADSAQKIYDTVTQQPVLKGGLRKLENKVKYPEKCWDADVEGRVEVQFIVNKQGEVKNPTVTKGIGHGCDKEALRVVKQAQFKPGKENGKPVNVRYKLPIVFTKPD
jgi:TonB family protein